MTEYKKVRRDTVEYRRIILQKAQELFNIHGVDKVSMHQIAQAAGVGQGTLYRRYAHKGELCLDLKREKCTSFFQELDSYLKDSNKESSRDKMIGVLRRILQFSAEQSALLSLMQIKPVVTGCSEAPSRRTFHHSPVYEQLHRIIKQQLKELQDEQGVEFDIVYTTDAILSALAPDLYVFLCNDRGYSNEQILERMIKLFIDPILRS